MHFLRMYTCCFHFFIFFPSFHVSDQAFTSTSLLKLSSTHDKRSKVCFRFSWFSSCGTIPVPWLLLGIFVLMLYLEKQACPKALSWHLLLAQQLGIWAVNHTALEDSIQGLPLWAAPPCPIYLPFSTLSNGNNDTTYILGFFKKKF